MGDLPPNPTHHPLPPNPTTGDTAGHRSPARQMDPPQAGRPGDPRDEFPRGFTRGGFAPIPQRHPEMPPAPAQEHQRERSPPPPPRNYDRDFERDRDPPRRADREFPRRDLDPEPEMGTRSWDTYYERTGRGGPPPRDDDYGRPKRRRSPSPYDTASRTRYRSPTPPPRFPPNPPAHGLPDPAEIDYVLNFRQFSDWFRASHPQTAKTDDEDTRRVKAEIDAGTAPDGGREKVGMAKRYDRYRKEYLSRQLYAMYLTHGQSAWFRERYSTEPRYATMRKRLHRQGRVPTVEKYIAEVREGKWDEVCYDLSDYYKKTGTAPPDSDQPEGMDQPLGENGSHDLVPRVEAAPEGKQVFIKTVPPSTERLDLEEILSKLDGYIHLAITEPHTKKAYHRVAWAQFAEDTDLEEVLRKVNNFKIDTFTFHLGINSTSVIGRMKFAAPIASTTDRLLYDGENAKALAIKLEDDLVAPSPDESSESKPDMSIDKPVKALEERGSHVVEETISRLLEKQGLDGAELNQEQAHLKARIVLDQWLSYLRNGLSTCYYCVAPTDFPEELQRKCIAHMRRDTDGAKNDAGIESDRKGGDRDDDAEGRYDGDRDGHRQEGQSSKKTLFPQRSIDEKWEANIDARLKPLLGPVDVVEYGGRDLQEESKKVAAPHIRQEEATKYRCKECNKLFKAPEFVVKHVIVKHSDLLGDHLDNIPVFNNYVLDPQHAHPLANAPAAINDALPIDINAGGHLNPNMPVGDMSGGNLMMQQQMMMMLQMQQAMMMGQMQFPQQQQGGQEGVGGGMGAGGADLLNRVGGYASRDADLGPLPPAPAGGEDPRAKRGRVSYQDLDQPGGAGDGGLPY